MRLPTGETQNSGVKAHPEWLEGMGDGMRGSVGYEAIKRASDVVFSAFALVLLSPALFVFMGMIVLDDPAAGLTYVFERVGKEGKRFRLYKFRSLYADAEARLNDLLPMNETDGPAFKFKKEPRVTCEGRFLRSYWLYEVCRRVNVLGGEM